ncbi:MULTISPECIES: DOMON-like domain-containing protein [unclassified Synechococcus]|uniref:DOMON-like domain-containing protein n=1 Tax=unclassified Synechococcus TaxID=2626047 RepID=UPI0021A4A1D6|nr:MULTISPECIES: DOMON-like domain-containing protein [unclassified Synechococcus]MCT0214514.1 DOMON-like domain-containing protein [Synechococcus sp. CS-1326]MCT0233183.1 DOMON-like domain-containing protein [Synechococcus sp. CS-1327]
MSSAAGRLRPFEADAALQAFTLQFDLGRRGAQLDIHYQLLGPIEALVLPAVASPPRRLDDLWQQTCFECFVAIEAQPAYWEMNLSPSGDWNLYRLSAYRQELEPEKACHALTPSSLRSDNAYSLDVSLDLAPFIPGDQTLEIAVAAVIMQRSGELSHWSLAHPAPAPDFHHRNGFLLRL